MLYRSVLLAVLLLAFPGDDGRRDGRRGNALYEQGDYAGAVAAYEAGLAAAGAAPGALQAGLLNNLGAALYRMEEYEAAHEAFTRSMAVAEAAADRARAAYNAGNTAVARQKLEEALGFYRQALLADPDDEAAKFNYEFVKRRLEEQQQQQQQQPQEGDQQQGEDESQSEGGQNQQGEGEQEPDDGEQDGEQQGEGRPDQQPASEQQPEPPREGDEQQGPSQAPPPDPNQLSRAQAERILQALQNDEEQLLRQVLRPRTRPRQVEKDW